jgi:hypothetical protein
MELMQTTDKKSAAVLTAALERPLAAAFDREEEGSRSGEDRS